jgi:hypothetical protein
MSPVVLDCEHGFGTSCLMNLSRRFPGILRTALVAMAVCWAPPGARGADKNDTRWPTLKQLRATPHNKKEGELARVLKGWMPEQHYSLRDLAEIISDANGFRLSVDSEIKAIFERLGATPNLAKKYPMADCLLAASSMGDPSWTSFREGTKAAASFLRIAVREHGMKVARRALAAVSPAGKMPEEDAPPAAWVTYSRLRNQRLAMFYAMCFVWTETRLAGLAEMQASLPKCPPFAGEIPKEFEEQYGPLAVASLKEVTRLHEWVRAIRKANRMDERDGSDKEGAKQVDLGDPQWERLVEDFFVDPGKVSMQRLMGFRQKPENTDVPRGDIYRMQQSLITMIRLRDADVASLVAKLGRYASGLNSDLWTIERIIPLTGVNLDALKGAWFLPFRAGTGSYFFGYPHSESQLLAFQDPLLLVKITLAAEEGVLFRKGVAWKRDDEKRQWVPMPEGNITSQADSCIEFFAKGGVELPEELKTRLEKVITQRIRAEADEHQRRELVRKMRFHRCAAWEEIVNEYLRSPLDRDVAVAAQVFSYWGRLTVFTPREGVRFELRFNGKPLSSNGSLEQMRAFIRVEAAQVEGQKPWPMGFPVLGADGLLTLEHDQIVPLAKSGRPLSLILRPASTSRSTNSLDEKSFGVPWVSVPVKLAEDSAGKQVIELSVAAMTVNVSIPNGAADNGMVEMLLRRTDLPARGTFDEELPTGFYVPQGEACVFPYLGTGTYSLRVNVRGAAAWQNETIEVRPNMPPVAVKLEPARRLEVQIPWPGVSITGANGERLIDVPEAVVGYYEPFAVLERDGVGVPNSHTGYNAATGLLVVGDVPAGKYRLRIRSSREIEASGFKAKTITAGRFSKHWKGTSVDVEVLADSDATKHPVPVALLPE